MKKIICFITVILLLPSIFCFAELPLTTEHTLDINDADPLEKEFWDYIYSKCENECITASIMGIIYRESNFKSNAVAGWYLAKWTDLSADLTALVDEGLENSSSLDEFIYRSRYVHGGYGLIQWCMPKTLTRLYNFIKYRQTTIADIKAQIDFTFWDLQENHWKTWDNIKDSDDLYLVNWWLATYYEGTTSPGTTYYYAMTFYNRYKKNGNS